MLILLGSKVWTDNGTNTTHRLLIATVAAHFPMIYTTVNTTTHTTSTKCQ